LDIVNSIVVFYGRISKDGRFSCSKKSFPGLGGDNPGLSGWLSGVGFGLTGDLPLPPLQSSNAGMGPMGEDFFL